MTLIKLLNDKKVGQSTDIPSKLIKEFRDLFSELIYRSINHCITDESFIADFKEAKKIMEAQINQTTDQLVLFLFQKYMKDTFIVNYAIILMNICFENTNVAFVKASVLSMPF